VPLNPAGQFGNPADGLWAATVTSYGRAPTMDVTPLDPGVRRLFTSLDWAGLDDIGWDTDHLAVTAEPPATVDGTEAFGITVTAEEPDGHVDAAFDGPETLSLADGPAGDLLGTTTGDASGGVATFAGLIDEQTAQDGMMLASADGGMTTVTMAPYDSTGGSPGAPNIDERALFAGAGRSHHLVGFELVFTGATETSHAAGSDRYAITQTEKRKRKSVAEPVAFIARYEAATDSVDLLVIGKPAFKMGGQIIVDAPASDGIVSVSGADLPDARAAIAGRFKRQPSGPVVAGGRPRPGLARRYRPGPRYRVRGPIAPRSCRRGR
jgi:hypothetical protein